MARQSDWNSDRLVRMQAEQESHFHAREFKTSSSPAEEASALITQS
jgi:hypothetical protein